VRKTRAVTDSIVPATGEDDEDDQARLASRAVTQERRANDYEVTIYNEPAALGVKQGYKME
jgi:hypothetical protein